MRKINIGNPLDIIVIGGGATGFGVALESSTRGYSTLLLEMDDFAKSTSSKSTKLIHGGIRYLAQGNVPLVWEALRERELLMKNASDYVKPIKILIPCYSWLSLFYYWVGIKIYDLISMSKNSFMSSKLLSKKTIQKNHHSLVQKGIKGGVLYSDGQFEDTQLIMAILKTLHLYGGWALNYCKVTNFIKNKEGEIIGVEAKEKLSGEVFKLYGKCIVNATGVFVDTIMQKDSKKSEVSIRPSQGIHIVLNKKFLEEKKAILIPKTKDKRIIFIIPWKKKTLIGTTDTIINEISLNPKPKNKEIDFLLETAKEYLNKKPQREDIKSVFTGLRPLFSMNKNQKTKDISRKHKIILSPSGLLSILGGKWTTFRKMGFDSIEKMIKNKKLPYKKSISHQVKLVSKNKHKNLKKSIYIAIKEEMAICVEDYLSRRNKLLFLNAEKAIKIAPKVAKIMAKYLNKDEKWIKKEIDIFQKNAQDYLHKNASN